MANTIKLTEADVKAVNEYLAETAERISMYGDSTFETEDGEEIRLENGMRLYISGGVSSERYCIDRGDYLQPPHYGCSVYLDITDITAYDSDETDHAVEYGYGELKTSYSFD